MTSNQEVIPRESILVEDDRTGTSQETLRRAMFDNLFYVQGKFSFDRSIREYCEHIWQAQSVPIDLAPLKL
jgi:hypothetical protein